MTDLVVSAPARVKLVGEDAAPMTGVAGVSSAPVPPPSYSPSMDFSDDRNSMYIPLGIA